jgi:hypothetical protein
MITLFTGIPIVYSAYKDWVLLILIFTMIINIIAYYYKPQSVHLLFQAIFNFSIAEKILEQKNSISLRINSLLNFSFYINLSLIVFIALQYKNISFPLITNVYLQLLIICILIPGIYYFRILIYFVVGWITNHTKTQTLFINYWMLLNKIYGLSLVPGVILILYIPKAYSNIILWIYLFLFVLLFLAKIFHGIYLSRQNRFSLFSFILYLCALEIMPIGMLIKHLISN